MSAFTPYLRALWRLEATVRGTVQPKPEPKKRKAKRIAKRRIAPVVLFTDSTPAAPKPAPVESDEARIIRLTAEAQMQRAPQPVPTSAPSAGRRQCDVVDGSCNRRCCLLQGHEGQHRHARGAFLFSEQPRRDVAAVAWRATS